MKKLALILTLFASALVWAQADIEAGKAKSLICIACHGADGNSMVANYPKLAGQHPRYLDKQLHDLKLGMLTGGQQGRFDPIMSAMTLSLSDQDISDLAFYYASNPMSAKFTADEASDKGKALYRAGDSTRQIVACMACHGPTGQGTNSSGFPRLAGQHAWYLKQQLEKFRAGGRSNDQSGMMVDIAQYLSDQDIEQLAAYLAGLR